MTATDQIPAQLREATTVAKIGLTGAAIAAAVLVLVSLALAYADSERDQAMREWRVRLGIIADTRADAVGRWVERHYGALSAVADNASVQLYLSELANRRTDVAPDDQNLALTGYLKNLLSVTADRSGFARPRAESEIAANVNRVGVSGIALTAADGRILTATDGAPPVDGGLLQFLSDAPRGERALRDVYPGADGSKSLAFAVPVFGVQSGNGPADQIGWVLGIREIDASLSAEMRQPGATWRTAEAALVRRAGDTVDYLTPGTDGLTPAGRRVDGGAAEFAAAFAIAHPGGFGVSRDPAGQEVLVASRQVDNAPWTVMYKIDRAEALGPSDARIAGTVAAMLLTVALVAAGIVAAWRHGASQRASAAAAKYEELGKRHETQSKFLKLVTDSQPNPMFIVDSEGRYSFANRAAAQLAGIADRDMTGKTMASVLGPADAARYQRLNADAMRNGTVQSGVHRIAANGATRVIQADHIPIAGGGSLPPGVLVVEQDITAAVSERETRERMMGQLVNTLVTLVDRRDPSAAHHSARVAATAQSVAEEMGLDDTLIETARLAGTLMNVGKIAVPEEILTRAGRLTDDELQRIRDSMATSASLLQGIDFPGPVIETLRQMGEHWDGSGGPRGLRGEEILITARIVAVANAFVAMISPRAYRGEVDVDRAIREVQARSGEVFDRRVVSALVHILDNKNGINELEEADRLCPAV